MADSFRGTAESYGVAGSVSAIAEGLVTAGTHFITLRVVGISTGSCSDLNKGSLRRTGLRYEEMVSLRWLDAVGRDMECRRNAELGLVFRAAGC